MSTLPPSEDSIKRRSDVAVDFCLVYTLMGYKVCRLCFPMCCFRTDLSARSSPLQMHSTSPLSRKTGQEPVSGS